MHDLDDLVDQVTIARNLSTKTTAVNNWTVRYPDYPKPLIRLRGAPIYSWDEVKAWYIHHFGMRRYETVTRVTFDLEDE